MIKGNESDVGNIDFEFKPKRGDKFSCFTMFLKFVELFLILHSDVQMRWGLDQNIAF